jgi:hypothetical protein
MTQIFIPVSVGELYDKITILSIKYEKVTDPYKKSMVEKELNYLQRINVPAYPIESLVEALKQVNTRLWEIEDRIREKERTKTFDLEFIELARSVYQTNDARSTLKQDICKRTNSELMDIKNYVEYLHGNPGVSNQAIDFKAPQRPHPE